jgi:hypothetical protein
MTSIRSETRVIKNNTYVVQPFPALEGFLLSVKISDIVQSQNIVERILEKDKDGSLVLQLFSRVTRNDMAISKEYFDKIYARNYSEMCQAILFVVEVNFSDVFQDASILLERINGLFQAKEQIEAKETEKAKTHSNQE